MWWRRKRAADASAQSTNAATPSTNPADVALNAEVARIIDSFRPFIQADGGDIDFVGIHDGIVRVRLRGACAGCPSSFMTLQMGIERALREKLPAVRAVENIS